MMAINKEEMEVIRKKTRYDEIENIHKVPRFLLRNHKVLLPKITKAQFNEMKEHDCENRILDFTNKE